MDYNEESLTSDEAWAYLSPSPSGSRVLLQVPSPSPRTRSVEQKKGPFSYKPLATKKVSDPFQLTLLYQSSLRVDSANLGSFPLQEKCNTHYGNPFRNPVALCEHPILFPEIETSYYSEEYHMQTWKPVAVTSEIWCVLLEISPGRNTMWRPLRGVPETHREDPWNTLQKLLETLCAGPPKHVAETLQTRCKYAQDA